MTIKQQGGIFGRNPTFNDLTSNTGQFDGLITANGEVVIQGNNNAADNNTLQIKNTDTAVGSGDNIGKIEFYNSDVSDAGVAVTVKAEAASGTGLTDLVFITGKPSDSTESMRVTYNHHLDMTTGGGYVKLGNGAGIDFSATSGTGTSELFDDYEEGTWTPAFKLVSAPTYSEQTGHYTKIGRQVYFYAKITFSGLSNSDTSPMTFSLPFTPTQDGCSATLTGSSNDGLNIADTAAVYFKVDSGSNSLYFGGVNDANEYDYSAATTNTSGTIEVAGTFTA